MVTKTTDPPFFLPSFLLCYPLPAILGLCWKQLICHSLPAILCLCWKQQQKQFVWSSIRWLAYSYHYFMGNSREAERWYHECIDYDPSRVDCIAFLSRVHSDSKFSASK